MRLYFERAGRYMLKMLILLSVLMSAMVLTGTSTVGGGDLLVVMFHSWRGWFVLGLLVALTAAYPLIGFGRAEVRLDMDRDRDAVVNGFGSMGFVLAAEHEGTMTFRPRSGLRRLLNAWNDTVTVERGRHGVTIEGLKKDVLKADMRIRLYMTK